MLQNATQNMKPGIGSIRAELLKELSETEIERLEFRWKQALEDAHGEWPDPTVSEDKRNEWLSRVTKVLYKFFLRSGLQQEDSRRSRIDDVRRVCVARQKYSLDDVLEYAKIELQLHKEGKSRTLNDVLENDMPKTKPAPAKTDDTDAKVTILLSRLNGVDKKYHREHEDNSILRDMLCDGFPKVHDWFDLVRLPDYDVNEAERRYDNIVGNIAKGPERMTLDEIDASIAAMPPTPVNDLPKSNLAASVSPDEPKSDVGPIDELSGYLQRQANGAPNPDPKYTPPAEEHWSKDDKERTLFFGHMKEDFSHFRESAMMKAEERLAFIHEALGNIEHLHQTPLTRDNAEAMVRDLLSKRYSTAAKVGWTNDKELDMPTEKQPEPPTQPKVENAPISNEKASNLNDVPKSEAKTDAPKIEANLTANPNGAEKAITIEFTPAPILDEIKTLGGVPLSKLHHVMNRKFAKQYYKAIKAKDGNENGWTDLDPVGVRKRMDKVFGPQGFGWRIVPMQGIGQVVYDGVELQHVKEYVKDGKVIKPAYDRKLHSVSMQCFTFEYALIQDGKIHYVQTSAFSCTCAMDDRDDAYKGAFTGIMKMALKFFSGYDHFMDKAAAA